MVMRSKKGNRKYLGRRSWGKGNVKNARGAGGRGGVGGGGRGIGTGASKHKWTSTVLDMSQVGKHGFTRWGKVKLNVINLDGVSTQAHASKEAKPVLELRGFKVLSSGTLTKAAQIKATAFSEKAKEKITAAGGEAVTL